jgi:hypothetical protein
MGGTEMQMSDTIRRAIYDPTLVEQTVTETRPARTEERVDALLGFIEVYLRDETECFFHAAEAGELMPSTDVDAQVEFTRRSLAEDWARHDLGWERPRLRLVRGIPLGSVGAR